MKRTLLAFFALIFSFFLPFVALAQETEAPDSSASKPVIYPADGPPSILGQNHNYSVVFRGNGEAVVTLKVALRNEGISGLSEVLLRVPKINPENISAYQIIMDRQCVRYGPSVYNPTTGTYDTAVCLQYQEPDYFSYYGQARYQKAEYKYEGDTIFVTLPQTIGPSASGSFFLHFRAMGYVKKNAFGAYKYEFETLKVNDSIVSLNIGINTDSDLVLRGANGEVNYRYSEPELAKLDSASAGAPSSNTQLDQFVSQIGYGTITKTASNLAPLESYSTDGAYADSRLKLYAKELAMGTLVVLFAILMLIFVSRAMLRMMRRGRETSEVRESHVSTQAPVMFLMSGAVGFAMAFLAVGYSVFLMLLMENLNSLLNYQYEGIFAIIILLISLGIYLLLLILPSIIVGLKKGAMWGVVTFVSTIIWLILMLIFLFVGVSLITGGIDEVYPLFRRSIGDPGVPAIAE